MKRFKCVKGWARNQVGDVVEEWEYKRFPESAHKCYEEIVDEPPKKRVDVPANIKVKSKLENDITN